MRRLLLFRQIGKACLGFHEPAHQGGGVGLYQRGEQRLFAGKIAVERSGGHPGVLDDLPQGSAEEPLLGKFLQSGLLYFL